MRKILPVFFILAGFASFASGAGTWQLRISGGSGFISPGDLNTFLRDYVRVAEADSGSAARGPGFKTVGGATDFEGTVFIPIESRIQVLVAFGHINAGTTGNEFTVSYPAVDKTFTREDQIRDYYGRLGIVYAIPAARGLSFRPYAAGEFHWASFEDKGSWAHINLETGERSLWMDWTVKTSAFRPGFSAGLEIEIAPLPSLRVWLDGGYRRAKITGFKGDFSTFRGYPGGGYSEESSDAPLYYFEFDDTGEGPVYGSLNTPDVWGGHHLTAIRDATLDFSGFYLKAGLGIAF